MEQQKLLPYLSSMGQQKHLPYLECFRVISNISLALVNSGESQFIPFTTLYSTFESDSRIGNNNSIAANNYDIQNLLANIEDFDFVLGFPTGQHILIVFILNKIYLDLKNLCNSSRQEIQRKLKFLINTIDAVPPTTQKLVHQLLVMKTDIDQESKDLLLSFNQQIKLFNSIQVEAKKEFYSVPLKHLEGYVTNKIFLDLSYLLESISLSLHYKLAENLLSLKEKIFNNFSVDDVYNDFYNLIHDIGSNIDAKEFDMKQSHNDEEENKMYIQRLLVNLVKLGENALELKRIEAKLYEYSLEHKIKLSHVIDEEIHNLIPIVSRQNIVEARLALRMDDDVYPLSVSYREFIRSLL